MRRPCRHREERPSVTSVEVNTTLDGAFFPDGVVAANHRNATPAASPADAADDMRNVVVERVEIARDEAAIEANIEVVLDAERRDRATGALFKSDGGAEAVAAGEGVGDLVRIERAVADDVVVGSRRRHSR